MHLPNPPEIRGLRVLVRYRRDMPPDEELLQQVEACLVDLGFNPIVERRRWLGLEWARDVARAGFEGGRSRSCSSAVERVGLEIESVPDSMAVSSEVGVAPTSAAEAGADAILWQGPGDDAAVEAFLRSRLGPASPSGRAIRVDVENGLHLRGRVAGPERKARPLEAIGGAMPLTSEFYLVRSADAEVLRALDNDEGLIHIKGGRQMGKTSLLARALQYARDRGDRVVLSDLQKLNSGSLETLEGVYLALAETFADQLDLPVWPREAWRPERSPNDNFHDYVWRQALGREDRRLVWGMDEVDRVLATPHGRDVFGLFRSWQNDRAVNPGGVRGHLTLIISYATEAHLFLRDPNQSPFNTGVRVFLDDFTVEQVAELNERCGSPLATGAELEAFHALVHGQPYLTRQALNVMAARGFGLSGLLREVDAEQGLFGDHLRRILMSLQRDPGLEEAVRRVLTHQPCPTPDVFHRLRAAGVLRGAAPAEARPRCELYERYLSRHLLSDS